MRIDDLAAFQANYWLVRDGPAPTLLATTGVAAGDSPDNIELARTLSWSPDGESLLLAVRWLHPDILTDDSGAAVAWPFLVLRPGLPPRPVVVASDAAWLDVRTVLAVVDGQLRRFSLASDDGERPFPNSIVATGLSVAPDGSRFSALNETPGGVGVTVYSADGASLDHFEAHSDPLGGPDGLAHLVWSPDAESTLYRDPAGAVRLWRSGAGDPATLAGVSDPLPAVAWSPEGGRVALAADRRLQVFAVDATPAAEVEFAAPVSRVAWSPAGDHLLAFVLDEQATIDAQLSIHLLTPSLRELHVFHAHRCTDAAWSPSGRYLAIAFVGCY